MSRYLPSCLDLVRDVLRQMAVEGYAPRTLSTSELRPEVSLDQLGLDSIGWTMFLTEIENALDRSVPLQRARGVKTLGEFCQILEDQ